ncbi:hypothetical protein AWC02_09970 [Mycolicibacter engbaekii]|uniref:Lipoprotein n=2 Tax=Mycolicibacter engbaekii TaxID=188915 RepID=A0A1X1TRG9_9MYCO|nr:hypothetical protein AWC02_09970 [Mycolicibacter engbaekii]
MMRITATLWAALASVGLAACGTDTGNTTPEPTQTETSGTVAAPLGDRLDTDGTASYFWPIQPKGYALFSVESGEPPDIHVFCPHDVAGCTTVKSGDKIHVVADYQTIEVPSFAKGPMPTFVVQHITLK